MHVLNCFATRVVKLQYLVLVLVIFSIKDNGQILIKIHSHVKEVQWKEMKGKYLNNFIDTLSFSLRNRNEKGFLVKIYNGKS